jgi:feruloyl esterase
MTQVSIALLLASLTTGSAVAMPCASLPTLALPNATITLAQAVNAGPFTPPGSDEPSRPLPAFCRVAATLTPTRDSDIKIEVWMPASGWNGKFQAVGNGAFNGSIAYPAMMTALPGVTRRARPTPGTRETTRGSRQAFPRR